jgi:hypothetical protein
MSNEPTAIDIAEMLAKCAAYAAKLGIHFTVWGHSNSVDVESGAVGAEFVRSLGDVEIWGPHKRNNGTSWQTVKATVSGCHLEVNENLPDTREAEAKRTELRAQIALAEAELAELDGGQ